MTDPHSIAAIDATLIRAGQQLLALQRRAERDRDVQLIERSRLYLSWARQELALVGAPAPAKMIIEGVARRREPAEAHA